VRGRSRGPYFCSSPQQQPDRPGGERWHRPTTGFDAGGSQRRRAPPGTQQVQPNPTCAGPKHRTQGALNNPRHRAQPNTSGRWQGTDTDPSPPDTSLPGLTLFIQSGTAPAGELRGSRCRVGRECSGTRAGQICTLATLHLGRKLEMAPLSSQETAGFNVSAPPCTLAACRDQFPGPLGPSFPSTSQSAGADRFAYDTVLGEDPEGDSNIPYRGLLLLRVRIAFVICAKRGV